MKEDRQAPMDEGLKLYFSSAHRKVLLILTFIVLIFAISVISIGSGHYHISPIETIKAFFHCADNETDNVIVWNLRMPLVVAAILVGASLGVAGSAMQCVLKNPLASPYTLGISGAAAFGAGFAILCANNVLIVGTFLQDIFASPYGIALSAFLFAMLTVAIIVILSRFVGVSPETMILTGVAVSAIFGAATSSLQYFSEDTTLSQMVFWQFGDFSKASWKELGLIFMAFLPTMFYFYYRRLDYNSMESGNDVARSLGINVNREVIVTMVLASTITAVCISVVGIIGFVGLLGPHIVRRLIGNDYRYLLPTSALVGAFILLFADYIGRVCFTQTIPVGIITSFIGGPLFIYLLLKGYKRRRA